MAARRGYVEIARALLDCGAAIEARDSKGDTPLQRAINCRRSAVSQLLAERGRPAGKAEIAGRKDDRRERAAARAALAPLRKQAKDAEARLAKLTAERVSIEAKLADPALYAVGRANDITAANARLASIRREAEAAEAQWLAAEEALEAAS